MNVSNFEPNWQIEKIEWAILPGKRARHAGFNARKGEHGIDVPLHLARVTIAGYEGCGWSRITKQSAQELVGKKARDMFNERGTVREEFRGIEFPLFDWIGRVQGKPVNSLISAGSSAQQKVACYDTSLYLDDLHLSDDLAAVEFMKTEALEGMNRGHANFKLKVGRGARHMPLMKGTERDIAIIRGIREAAGPYGKIMIDANNGYNLNLTKHVLQETADVKLYWVEEAFHEDEEFYKDLKAWMQKAGINVLIADGEGLAAPTLVQWAKEGIIDVVQHDVLAPGFSHWLELGPELDAAHVKSAPHSYGTPYGNYALSHLASAIKGFQFVEWDQIEVEGMDASGYRIEDGFVHVPSEPGFGLNFDDAYVSKRVQESGWTTGL
ncbi:mandelate racemase [Cohnella sp. CIP 111063]|uniref:enolase C-terminal domain-like protein n=1 Tax=unclassified Cohnella TaxID=2636738 RepID=UPI000B8C08A1|nr:MULTISPECIES: enolase C-terminal domain-like protein [unclassified Cohnella]OXS60937.1 mandelate racemase [Cohnella sp. CIP 111063]PRX73470.1 L-alanine-DL-glutamate epimerase-like enolase superfamily enzyme [Cohnella sp. SGD-V74]